MKLSKTNYLLWRECSKNAWVKVNKPEEFAKFPLSEFEKNIIESGNEVDKLARDLFPGGTLVEERNDFEKTKELIKNKTKVIYQPVFETGKFITALDILVWNESANGYDVYEVKSSTTSEEDNKAKKEELYTYDLAFQYYLLRIYNTVVSDEYKVNYNKFYIVRLNKDYVRDGELNLKRLFKIEDYTEKVPLIEDLVREEIMSAWDDINAPELLGDNCKCIYLGRAAQCTTFKFSNPNYPEYAVNDIYRIGQSKAKLMNLVSSKILSIYDIPSDFELSETQRNQVDVANGRETIIDNEGIEDFFSKIEFPISFIDYETYPSALPLFDGYRPYNQVPFQFSLHIVESEDEPVVQIQHLEFLYTKNSKPDFEFIDALMKSLPKTGTVISWNKSFENTINKELGLRNQSAQKFLNDLIERTVDLRDVFTKQLFVHKDFKGKTSIKKILPVLAPEFSYGDLEVQEGGQASEAWHKIVTGQFGPGETEAYKQHLLEYCKLDTYAMYLIWKHLINKINNVYEKRIQNQSKEISRV